MTEPCAVRGQRRPAQAGALPIVIDLLLAVLEDRSPPIARWLDDLPTVIIREGRLVESAMQRTRVGVDDVMAAARTQQGLARFSDIRFAVLEGAGGISIIPWDGPREGAQADSKGAPNPAS